MIENNFVVIFIKNEQFLIYNEDVNQSIIVEIINHHKPNLLQVSLPLSIWVSGPIKLTRNLMRNFLKTADFGLVDPSQPLSENNPPLSKYIQFISDVASNSMLALCMTTYIKYEIIKNGRTAVNNTNRFTAVLPFLRLVIEKYFASQRQIIDLTLNRLLGLNNLRSLKLENVAIYDFPNYIPTKAILEKVLSVLLNTTDNYTRLMERAYNLLYDE